MVVGDDFNLKWSRNIKNTSPKWKLSIRIIKNNDIIIINQSISLASNSMNLSTS